MRRYRPQANASMARFAIRTPTVYALRNASWNLEYDFGFGNMRGNSGLYSWTKVADKAKRFHAEGGRVEFSPQENARIVKKAARFLGADLVGICYAHPNLIYSHELDLVGKEHRRVELPEGCTSAVVMARIRSLFTGCHFGSFHGARL